MYKRGFNMVLSDLYCPYCSFRMTIPRSVNRQREKGHCKKMWCPFCEIEANFIEVRYNDFILSNVGSVLYE